MIHRTALLGILVLAVPACVAGRNHDPGLRAELEAMYDTDQAHRREMAAVAAKFGDDSPQMSSLWKKQRPADEANISRLVEVIKEHGWPRRSLVGDKGTTAAFLVLQHADYDYQTKYLPLVKEAVDAGDARGADLALLKDRVLMREGKQQRYGTQVQRDDRGRWIFYPIEDGSNVDKRRQSVGLPPLAEYARHFGFEYPSPMNRHSYRLARRCRRGPQVRADMRQPGHRSERCERSREDAFMNTDEQAIRDLVGRWHTATAAGDGDTVLGLMAEDVVFLVAGQPAQRPQRLRARLARPVEIAPRGVARRHSGRRGVWGYDVLLERIDGAHGLFVGRRRRALAPAVRCPYSASEPMAHGCSAETQTCW